MRGVPSRVSERRLRRRAQAAGQACAAPHQSVRGNKPGPDQVCAVADRKVRQYAAAADGPRQRKRAGRGSRSHGACRFDQLSSPSARTDLRRFYGDATGLALNREGPMLGEFKKFAMRGNVVDLAVGVIIGAAFGAIVNSLVADIIMPLIGAVTGGLDFSNYFLPLSSKVTATALADARRQGAVLAWGNFVTLTINFLIIAWVLFVCIRAINRLKTPEAPAAPAPPSKEVQLLAEIRDLLKAR